MHLNLRRDLGEEEPMKGETGTAVRPRFAGWPKPAFAFFSGLKKDNSKAFFEAHRQVYEAQVRQPMESLLAELERDIGPGLAGKIFRLNRDLRFSPDKRPYKEHVGAVFMSNARANGVYLQISADGLYVAIGCHEMAPDQLTRYRDAVAGKGGEKLARMVAALLEDGYQIGEPHFKRVPAGYQADHPQADLLRRNGLMASRNWKPGPWLHSAEAKDRVRGALDDSKPLTSWLETQVGPSRVPARHVR
jgi:uncharacterized protein (TIGR02453 family)